MVYTHIKNIIEIISDLIFPRYLRCIVCNAELKEDTSYSLCKDCAKQIVLVDENTSCRVCGRGIYDEDSILCEDCSTQKPYFRRGFSVVIYNECAKKLVHGVKYSNKRYISFYMAKMMVDKLKKHYLNYDYILYVPIHIKKEQERGYNQAKLLADYISKDIGVPVNHSLIRIKYTGEMNKLSKKLRSLNLINAFDMEDKYVLRNKHVLLIDDVYTTGATANECARVLTEYGACHVDVLTFATGISYH